MLLAVLLPALLLAGIWFGTYTFAVGHLQMGRFLAYLEDSRAEQLLRVFFDIAPIVIFAVGVFNPGSPLFSLDSDVGTDDMNTLRRVVTACPELMPWMAAVCASGRGLLELDCDAALWYAWRQGKDIEVGAETPGTPGTTEQAYASLLESLGMRQPPKPTRRRLADLTAGEFKQVVWFRTIAGCVGALVLLGCGQGYLYPLFHTIYDVIS